MRYWLNRDGIDNYSEMIFSCSSYSSSSGIMDGQFFKCKTESKNHTNPDYRLKTSKYDFYVYVEDMYTNQYGVCWQGNKVSNLDIYWYH